MSGKYALDFAKIKEDYPIEKVAARLGLTLKPNGQSLRGPCRADLAP